MKLLALVSLLASMAFSAAQAKEVFTQEFDLLPTTGPYSGMVQSDAKFYVDMQAQQGSMEVTAYEYINDYPLPPRHCGPYYCEPSPAPIPRQWLLLNTKVEIPGLVVEGKKLVYKGEAGDVVCASLSRTRWLGNLQINLTGNCQLRSRYSYGDRTLKASFHIQ